MVLIIATKKEDLERAAELAVERAAERVAERAVEKALEAGNSSTTTVTVKEGYSNARKVAEEQAAPGSESTRHLSDQSDSLPPDEYTYLGGRQHARSDGNVEYDEESARILSKEEGNVDYRDEKNPTNNGKTEEMSKASEFEDYQDEISENNKEKEGSEGDDTDLSHESKAWKDYSNWENGFKSASKENWTGKSSWAGDGNDDAFFWDMDDSETKHNYQHKIKKIPITKFHAVKTSKKISKKGNSEPDEDTFSWNEKPFRIESTTKYVKAKEKPSIFDLFTTERNKYASEGDKKRYEKISYKVSEKIHDVFEDAEFMDGQTSDREWVTSESEKHNVWLNKHAQKNDRTSKEDDEFDSWETKEMDSEESVSTENTKRDSASWESTETSESKITTTMISPPKSDEIHTAEIKHLDFGSPVWKVSPNDEELSRSRESDEIQFNNTNFQTNYSPKNSSNFKFQQERILTAVRDNTETDPVKTQKINFRLKQKNVPSIKYLDPQFNPRRIKTRKVRINIEIK